MEIRQVLVTGGTGYLGGAWPSRRCWRRGIGSGRWPGREL